MVLVAGHILFFLSRFINNNERGNYHRSREYTSRKKMHIKQCNQRAMRVVEMFSGRARRLYLKPHLLVSQMIWFMAQGKKEHRSGNGMDIEPRKWQSRMSGISKTVDLLRVHNGGVFSFRIGDNNVLNRAQPIRALFIIAFCTHT